MLAEKFSTELKREYVPLLYQCPFIFPIRLKKKFPRLYVSDIRALMFIANMNFSPSRESS